VTIINAVSTIPLMSLIEMPIGYKLFFDFDAES
jgi:hypothetical protein